MHHQHGAAQAQQARHGEVVTQWFQTAKTRQNFDPKNREIDLSYLCLQQFYEFLIASTSNERPETEVMCYKNS